MPSDKYHILLIFETYFDKNHGTYFTKNGEKQTLSGNNGPSTGEGKYSINQCAETLHFLRPKSLGPFPYVGFCP